MAKFFFIAGNHKNIFNDARVPWSEYRYYDPKTVGLDFGGMITDIKVNILNIDRQLGKHIVVWWIITL